jgi:hypothetical protein
LARAPLHRDVARAACRPTSASAPHPAQGRPPSQAAPSPPNVPQGSWESARAARRHVRAVPAGRAPRTAGPTAAPRRTHAGRGRVPRLYLRRPLSSPRSYAAPINTLHFPSSAGIATPSRHLRCRRRAMPLPAFRSQATLHIPSLEPMEPSRATCCPGRAHAIAGAEPPRPPPSVPAARPCRRVLRPNSGHPQALGEPTVITVNREKPLAVPVQNETSIVFPIC